MEETEFPIRAAEEPFDARMDQVKNQPTVVRLTAPYGFDAESKAAFESKGQQVHFVPKGEPTFVPTEIAAYCHAHPPVVR